MTEWKVIVLAAGRSSRMGVPKPLLHLDGTEQTQLARKVSKYKSLGAAGVVVVLGYHEARVRRATEFCPLPAVDFVRNSRPEMGQTHSFKLGVRELGVENPALLQPVDQPLPPSEILEDIISRASGDDIVIPSFQKKRGHPPLFPSWFLKEIVDLPPDRGINSLYKEFDSDITHLEFAEPALLGDLDTPGDLYEYR